MALVQREGSSIGHINATIRQQASTKRDLETSPISEPVPRKRQRRPKLNAGFLPSTPTTHRHRPKRSLDTVLINPAKACSTDHILPTHQIEREADPCIVTHEPILKTEKRPTTPSVRTRRSVSRYTTAFSAKATKMNTPEDITSLDDLDPDILKLAIGEWEEKVIIPNLTVEPNDFWRFADAYSGEDCVAFEYDATSRKITVLLPATPIHQQVEKAIEIWFDHVGEVISDDKQQYCAWRQYEVHLSGSSSKVPDAVLMPNTSGIFPLVALEVGFTETLEQLYTDAEKLLQRSNGAIELVILIKVTEKERHVQNEYPWGSTSESLKNLRVEEIAGVIEAHFASKGLKLVGEMDVKVFLYGKFRKTRPFHPVHSFAYDPQTDQISRSANRSGDSKPPQVTIKSCRFELPVEMLEKAIRYGVPHERTRREMRMMKRTGFLD